jgi:hypothetical protein
MSLKLGLTAAATQWLHTSGVSLKVDSDRSINLHSIQFGEDCPLFT